MKHVDIWLNDAEFVKLAAKAQKDRTSVYAYVKSLILRDLNIV